jgi:hypothetical protein
VRSNVERKRRGWSRHQIERTSIRYPSQSDSQDEAREMYLNECMEVKETPDSFRGSRQARRYATRRVGWVERSATVMNLTFRTLIALVIHCSP